MTLFCVAVTIIEGIFFFLFFFQTKYVPQCEQMVPVLLFITTNLRLAGGYNLL